MIAWSQADGRRLLVPRWRQLVAGGDVRRPSPSRFRARRGDVPFSFALQSLLVLGVLNARVRGRALRCLTVAGAGGAHLGWTVRS